MNIEKPSYYSAPLSEEEYERFYSDDITVKEQKYIFTKITARSNYIVRCCYKFPDYTWWSFDENDLDRIEDFFYALTRENNVDCVKLQGNFNENEYYPYPHGCFPLKWLWQDFEEDLQKLLANEKDRLEKEKIQKKAKRIEKKKKEKEMLKSILDKLTAEECKFLGYRK